MDYVFGLEKLAVFWMYLSNFQSYLETLGEFKIVRVLGSNIIPEGDNKDEVYLLLRIRQGLAKNYQVVCLSPRENKRLFELSELPVERYELIIITRYEKSVEIAFLQQGVNIYTLVIPYEEQVKE